MTEQIPLAERMRPRSLADFVGQERVVGPQSVLYRILKSGGVPPSLVLFGSPGVGKTSLAQVLSNTLSLHFCRLSGVLDGVEGIRNGVRQAEENRRRDKKSTLLLVDEIHRFNKSQQDAFLPHVESGLIVLVGQTTENVSFRLRSALLSRLKVLELKPLTETDITEILRRALLDVERGLGNSGIRLTPEAMATIARISGGDARRALNCLEWSYFLARDIGSQDILVEHVREAFADQPQYFDADGDQHYDNLSAMIKSLRGSDPDAALYYMVRALEAGEDPLIITRRMMIFASEDASCDPRALALAVDVDSALQRIGLPEGRIPLAQAAVYLACCQKSNASYLALRKMEQIVRDNPNLPVPARLCNAPTDLMRSLGRSEGYRYPHDFPEAFVPERYLPDALGSLRVFQPTTRGIDAKMKERLDYFDSLIAKGGIKNG